MSNTNLIIAIVLPSTIAIAILVVTYFISRYVSNSEISQKGMKIYKLDLYSRKFMDIRVDKKNNILKTSKSRSWTPIKEITKRFVGNDDVDKLFRNVFNKIGAKRIDQSISFRAKAAHVSKKHFFDFTVEFSPMEDDSDYLMRVNWKIVKKTKKIQKADINIVDREYIVESTSKYKGLVIFNLNHDIVGAGDKLINILRRNIEDEMLFYKYNESLIVPFFGKKIKKIRKQIENFTKRVETKAFKNGAKSFFNGSGFTIKEGIDSNKNLNAVLKGLNFFVVVSIENNKSFVTSDESNKDFSNEDFVKFIEASKIFNAAIKAGEHETKLIPVRNKANGRKVIDYGYPTVKGLNPKMLSNILLNRNKRAELIDSHAKKVSIDSRMDRPLLIDINSDWLIKNETKIKFKKAIYIINVKNGTKYNELKDTMKNLSEKGFFFAIRIQNFNEMLATLIKKTKPQFILVDRSIWDDNGLPSSSTFIWLLTVKNLADNEKTKVIYENPSSFIDEKMAEQIGLKFYYNF